jgi:hypothetical protein
MKSSLALLLMSAILSSPVTAGNVPDGDAERAAVIKVVQEFFDALQAKDGARLRAICLPGAQVTSGRPTDKGFALRPRTVEVDAAHFAESKDTYLERMWAPTVLVTGRIAVLWTRYDFHLNGKFSHNGTDCFTLLKTDQGWKISNCAYSVEPGGVTENPAGAPH